jgi:hypothetical protein
MRYGPRLHLPRRRLHQHRRLLRQKRLHRGRGEIDVQVCGAALWDFWRQCDAAGAEELCEGYEGGEWCGAEEDEGCAAGFFGLGSGFGGRWESCGIR